MKTKRNVLETFFSTIFFNWHYFHLNICLFFFVLLANIIYIEWLKWFFFSFYSYSEASWSIQNWIKCLVKVSSSLPSMKNGANHFVFSRFKKSTLFRQRVGVHIGESEFFVFFPHSVGMDGKRQMKKNHSIIWGYVFVCPHT